MSGLGDTAGGGKPGKPKYPFARLAAVMGMSESQACRVLNIAGKTQKEYRSEGMSELVADRMAVKAGFAPAEVWPEMINRAIDDIQFADRQARADLIRHKAEVRRRWLQTDPGWSSQREAKQRWRESTRDYQNAYQRAWRAAHPEQNRQNATNFYKRNAEALRARRRAYYQANRDKELARQRAYDARKRASSSSDPQQADGMVA